MKRIYKNSILAETKGGNIAEFNLYEYAGRFYANVTYHNGMHGFTCGNPKGYKTENGAFTACKSEAEKRGMTIIEA